MSKPKPISRRQAIDYLYLQIYGLRRSYMNVIGPDKGKITDKGALHQIRCLRAAIRMLKREV